MLIRAVLLACIATNVIPAVAGEASPAPLSKANLESLVARHFAGAKPATDQGAKLPSYRTADFDGDGKLDLVVLYNDSETVKRGSGCYGIGIVTSYDDQDSAKTSYQLYNCLGEYTVDVREFIPIKIGGKEQRMDLQSPRPCVRIILKYGDRDFICYNNSRFASVYSTPRVRVPPNQALQRAAPP